MPPVTVEAMFQRAREALAQRDYDRAKKYYGRALDLQPENPNLHYGLASICFQLRDLRPAAHHFREVTRLDPLRADAYINLGAICNLLDLLDEAIAALRRGIQLDPHRAEGYYNLGLVYKHKNQLDLAIQAYQEAIRINPKMADAYFNLGNIYMERTQHQQAHRFYQHAVELRPGWEKGTRALEAVEELLAEAQASKSKKPLSSPVITGGVKPTAKPPSTPILKIDPKKVLDGNTHRKYLTTMHTESQQFDTAGREFLKKLEEHLEPTIKELTSCLLYPNSSVDEIDGCVDRIENGLKVLQQMHATMKTCMEHIRNAGEEMVAH